MTTKLISQQLLLFPTASTTPGDGGPGGKNAYTFSIAFSLCTTAACAFHTVGNDIEVTRMITFITTLVLCFSGMGGDPHYSIMLPSGQLLCFSVHGEKNFPFNLISNSLLQMNAFFIEDARREEITWIGSLGVVVQHAAYKKSNTTKMRFDAKEQTIYINNGVSLLAKRVERLTLANGKLTITEGLRRRGDRKPEVEVDLVDVGLHFTIRFVKKRHLDMVWNRVNLQPSDSHGIIGKLLNLHPEEFPVTLLCCSTGQFFRKGVEIDKVRKLLYLPNMDPVPVMRSSVWHFMERESPDPRDQKFCWQAMNPGYQGKMLIEGSYLDYLVDDVLTPDFMFDAKPTEL